MRYARVRWWGGRCSVLLCCVLAITPAVFAQAPASATELQVKAAYLFKFGAFVEWPPTAPSDSFAICVMGRDPFGHTLDDTIRGEQINGKKLVAKRIVLPEQAAQCQILYISDSEEARLRPILSAVGKMPVLTVSDITNFAERGGAIQFVLENGRVRFNVNLASAEKAGLTLSSQLLKVASSVQRSEGRD